MSDVRIFCCPWHESVSTYINEHRDDIDPDLLEETSLAALLAELDPSGKEGLNTKEGIAFCESLSGDLDQALRTIVAAVVADTDLDLVIEAAAGDVTEVTAQVKVVVMLPGGRSRS